MASDSTEEAMEIRPWKFLKLLSSYPSHAERKQKAQFIEDPKHIHGGKQGVCVWRGWFNLSLEVGGEELGFIFVGFVSPLSTPSPISPHILCNIFKILSNHPEDRVTLDLGEAQFFCTLLTNSPGITSYTEKHKSITSTNRNR